MNSAPLAFVTVAVLAGSLSACGPSAAESPETRVAPPPSVSDNDTARVLASISRARSEAGLPPADVIDDMPPLDTAAAMIRAGAPPEQAVATAMQRMVEVESSEARGWCIPTEDLDAPQLPSVVVEREEIRIAVVAVRKSAGAPPPPFVVCVMVLEDGSDLQGRGD